MQIKTHVMAAAMADKGIDLNDLVKVTGLSRSTVSSVKNGKSCTVQTLSKLAKALNVSASDLIKEGD